MIHFDRRSLLTIALTVVFLLFAVWVVFGEEAPHVRQPELKVLCWKIWYSNKTITCKQASWDKAPKADVQVVVVWYTKTYPDGLGRQIPYRHLCTFQDYYWLDGCGAADEAQAYKGSHSVKL